MQNRVSEGCDELLHDSRHLLFAVLGSLLYRLMSGILDLPLHAQVSDDADGKDREIHMPMILKKRYSAGVSKVGPVVER